MRRREELAYTLTAPHGAPPEYRPGSAALITRVYEVPQEGAAGVMKEGLRDPGVNPPQPEAFALS